mgnify:CR=1 FL=1
METISDGGGRAFGRPAKMIVEEGWECGEGGEEVLSD